MLLIEPFDCQAALRELGQEILCAAAGSPKRRRCDVGKAAAPHHLAALPQEIRSAICDALPLYDAFASLRLVSRSWRGLVDNATRLRRLADRQGIAPGVGAPATREALLRHCATENNLHAGRPRCSQPWKHPEAPWGIAWQPGQRRLLSVVCDEAARLLDARRHVELACWELGVVGAASFSPDGGALALTSWHCGAVVVDLLRLQPALEIALPAWAQDFAWSPDGVDLAILLSDGGMVLAHWSLRHVAAPRYFSSPARHLCWTPDGQSLALALDDHSVRLLDPGSGQQRSRQLFAGAIGGLAYAPDGAHRAVRLAQCVVVTDGGGRRALTTLPLGSAVPLWTWSRAGRYLAGAAPKNGVSLFDTWRGIMLPAFAHPRPVTALSWSPTADVLASGSQDGTVWLTDVALQQRLSSWTHLGRINALAFRPGGQQVVSASDDGTVRIVEVDGGVAPRTLQAPHGGAVADARWCDDGSTLALASYGVQVDLLDFSPAWPGPYALARRSELS